MEANNLNEKLIVVVMSDVHFSSRSDENSREFYTKALSSAKQRYGRVDGVFVLGDFSEGYEKDYDTMTELTAVNVGKDVPLFACYGNHEGDGKHYIYESKLSLPVDNVRFLNDYPVVCVGAHRGNTYLNSQAEWLDENLKTLSQSHPDKPIFVLIHHPPIGGLINPESSLNMIPVLQKYKNAIVLCGHDHQITDSMIFEPFLQYRVSPIQDSPDPNDIRQGYFSLLTISQDNKIKIQFNSVEKGKNPQYGLKTHILF